MARLGPDWIWVKKSKGEKDVNLDHVCLMLEYLGAEIVAGVGKLEVGGGVGEGLITLLSR